MAAGYGFRKPHPVRNSREKHEAGSCLPFLRKERRQTVTAATSLPLARRKAALPQAVKDGEASAAGASRTFTRRWTA